MVPNSASSFQSKPWDGARPRSPVSAGVGMGGRAAAQDFCNLGSEPVPSSRSSAAVQGRWIFLDHRFGMPKRRRRCTTDKRVRPSNRAIWLSGRVPRIFSSAGRHGLCLGHMGGCPVLAAGANRRQRPLDPPGQFLIGHGAQQLVFLASPASQGNSASPIHISVFRMSGDATPASSTGGNSFFSVRCPEVVTFGASRGPAQRRGLSPVNYGCGTKRQ